MIPLISVVGFIIIVVIIIIVFAILLLFQLSFISSWTRTCSKWCFMVKYIHVYDHLSCCNNSVYILSDFQSHIVSKLKKVRSLIFLKKNDKNNIELWILILYIYDYILCFCLSLKIFQHQFEYVWVILNHITYILQIAFIVPSLPPPKKSVMVCVY